MPNGAALSTPTYETVLPPKPTVGDLPTVGRAVYWLDALGNPHRAIYTGPDADTQAQVRAAGLLMMFDTLTMAVQDIAEKTPRWWQKATPTPR